MSICPQCQSRELITLAGSSRVCPNCEYYESDSEAFTLHPEIFRGLGKEILTRIKNEAIARGLDGGEAQAWIEQEPTFTKGIVMPLTHQTNGNSQTRQTKRYHRLLEKEIKVPPELQSRL